MSIAQESSAPPERGIILRRKKMRGGLGRTLLTAFLLLAIGPLSLVSLYVIHLCSLENGRQQEELMLLQTKRIRHQIVIASQQLKHSLLASNNENDTSTRWLFTTDGEIVEFTSEQPLPSWLDSERSLTEGKLAVYPLPCGLQRDYPLATIRGFGKTVASFRLSAYQSKLCLFSIRQSLYSTGRPGDSYFVRYCTFTASVDRRVNSEANGWHHLS